MAETQRTRLWTLLAVVTVLGALASTAPAGWTVAGCLDDSDCGCTQQNCSAPGQGGTCIMPDLNQTGPSYCLCNPGYGGPNCAPLGACCGVDFCARGLAQGTGCAAGCTDLTEAECQTYNGTFAGNGTTCDSGVCDATPTATATATATATETPTRVPQGGACADVSECAPGLFCTDAVCCDSACDGPQESCNQRGREGLCAAIVAPAPAASNSGLALMVGALIAIGLAAMALARRRT